jgi:hypothetical protein
MLTQGECEHGLFIEPTKEVALCCGVWYSLGIQGIQIANVLTARLQILQALAAGEDVVNHI